MPEIVLWQAVLFHKHITNNLFLAHHISASYFNSATQVLNLSGLDPGTVDLTQTYCPALNVSQCLVSKSFSWHCFLTDPLHCQVSEVAESFIVSVYNPLSWSVSPYIRCLWVSLCYHYRYRNFDDKKKL